MYCVNCGQELPNNAKYCSSCGHAVSGDAMSKIVGNDKIYNSALDIVVTDETISLESQTVVDDVITKARYIGDNPAPKVYTNVPTPRVEVQPVVEKIEVEDEDEVEEPLYPQESSKSYFGGAIKVKEIAYSESDVIYQVFDSEGAFEEDFQKVLFTKNQYILRAKCLKDGLFVLLQIDVANKKVKYATEHRYEKIVELSSGLYIFHGKSLASNELWQWNSACQRVEKIYQTSSWVETLDEDKSLYKLCRSYDDYWQYGIIKVVGSNVKIIMPHICDQVYGKYYNKEDYVARVSYKKNSDCYLSKDGWLYIEKPRVSTWWGLLLIALPLLTCFITGKWVFLLGILFMGAILGNWLTGAIYQKKVDIKSLIERLDKYAKRYSKRKNDAEGKEILEEMFKNEAKIYDKGLHFCVFGKYEALINHKDDDKWYKKQWLWVAVALVICAICLLCYVGINGNNDSAVPPTTNIEVIEDNLTNEPLQTYANDYYGFSLKYPSDLKIQSSSYSNVSMIDDDGDTKMLIKVQEISPFAVETMKDALVERVDNYKKQFDKTKNVYISPSEPCNIKDWVVASGYLDNGVCLYDKTIIASRTDKYGESIYILVSVIVETTDVESAKIAYYIKDYFKVDKSGKLI